MTDKHDYLMDRRTLLTLLGAGSLPILLDACQNGTTTTARSTPTPTATKKPATPTATPTLDDAAWSQLASSLHGTLVRPNSSQYATALQLFNPRFDTIHPAAIAYCTSPTDVQTCLAFVRKYNLAVTPRAGGHSYAGYSTTTGLVIDTTRMNTVSVNAGASTATIGAGTRLIDVYSSLAQQGFVLPAGSCPTVGVAGLTLGGGNGVLGRKYGLTIDSLLSAQIVLANGQTITSSANQNSDLFWALRGGGGGNFGVVTSFTFRIYQAPTLTLFTLLWPWSSAADVVDAWQSWGPNAPDELWSNCLLDSPADKSSDPIIEVNGVYVGTQGALAPLLAQLTSKISTAPTTNYVTNESVIDTMLYEAGCSNKTVAQCHLPTQNSQGQVQRDIAIEKSDYYSKPLSRDGINALVNAINQRHASSLGEAGIGMDAHGGAINRVSPSATAFIHRNALFSAQYSASLNSGDSASTIAANRTWLTNLWQSMRPYVNGQAYQNYIDPTLTNWQQAYYGSNLSRLKTIKSTYDPNNLFHFAQSIPLA
jgi:FAD/FMN-containing dehydrogenase